jgi:hypothetical protein
MVCSAQRSYYISGQLWLGVLVILVLLLLQCRIAVILKQRHELIVIKPVFQAGNSSTNGSISNHQHIWL